MFNQILGEESKRVGKWAAISLVLLSAFLLVKTVTDIKKLPKAGMEIYPQSTIMVSGTGEAFAIPDIATLSFSVTEVGESVEAAQALLDAKVNKALAVLKDAEIDEKDIKTTSYNVYPKYEWKQIYCITTPCPQGKNELIGYEVSEMVTVKIRDIKKAGDLVSKIGAVNVSNISGVEFTVDDRDKYVAEARAEAIEKAKAEAKVLAKELGVRLGRMLYYNENGGYPMYYGAEGMGGGVAMDKAVAPQARAELPEGETKITSQVSLTYEIR